MWLLYYFLLTFHDVGFSGTGAWKRRMQTQILTHVTAAILLKASQGTAHAHCSSTLSTASMGMDGNSLKSGALRHS